MPATYDLTGKTAVVTGGARGIGRAIVERFSDSVLVSTGDGCLWPKCEVQTGSRNVRCLRQTGHIADESRIPQSGYRNGHQTVRIEVSHG
jgi:NAD(P)-dependent dehydrogenase (short-subunit alcohol dehydrogenase family)